MNQTQARQRLERVVADTMTAAIVRDEWDLPPDLVLWFAHEDGMEHISMPAFQMIVQMVEGQIAEVPRVAAILVRKAAEDGVVLFERVRGQAFLAGIMYLHEGYGFMDQALENNLAEINAYLERGGKIADHPLGVETRNITVVGPGSYAYAAVHVRGEAEPVLLGTGERAVADGHVIDGMRDLRNAINEQLRTGG